MVKMEHESVMGEEEKGQGTGAWLREHRRLCHQYGRVTERERSLGAGNRH